MLVSSHAQTSQWKGVLEVQKQGPLSSSYCLTTQGGGTGSRAVLNKCSTTYNKNQVWTLHSVRSATVFTVKNVSEFQLQSAAASNECLNDWQASKVNSTQLRLYPCKSSDLPSTWVWGVKFGGGNWSHMMANLAASGGPNSNGKAAKCLDDYQASHAANTKVDVYACKSTGQSNQMWFEASAPKAGGGGSSSGGGSSGGSSASSGSTSGGCTSGGSVAPCVGSATTAASGWGKPVFDDEFTGTSLSSKWAPSWFNGGKVNNSNGVTMSSKNVAVSGGNLILTLASSSSGATIDTDPSQVSPGFQFGTGYYAEARMYIPGSGSTLYNWPAWWTDGQSWPTNGESDILEGLGTATSNYHSPQGANNSGTVAGTWSNGWHTYALDREAGKDFIYWDGKLVRSYTPDDGGAPQYLILSLDCSGNCKTGASYQLKVDYVRVWKK